MIHSFIHSFNLETYIAPLQDTTTQRRSHPRPVTAKEEGLKGDAKFGRVDHQQRTQLNGEIIPFIHSFISAISIAPLQVLYYSEALPTTARILYRSFTPKRTGNCR